jgi:hypothetical protein
MVELYATGNDVRDCELRRCLSLNYHNSELSMNMFSKSGDFIQQHSAWHAALDDVDQEYYWEFSRGNGRMTYKEFFEFANENLSGVVCLANSDIYFDSSIALIKPEHLDNTFMCLSRWRENQPDEAARDGHDAWIFKTPVKIPKGCDFTLGSIAQDPVLGVSCNDLCIAGLMAEAGYKIVNPGLDVKAYHVHESNYRNYNVTDSLLFKPKRRVLRSHLEKINV